jgi:hypothetical protein
MLEPCHDYAPLSSPRRVRPASVQNTVGAAKSGYAVEYPSMLVSGQLWPTLRVMSLLTARSDFA